MITSQELSVSARVTRIDFIWVFWLTKCITNYWFVWYGGTNDKRLHLKVWFNVLLKSLLHLGWPEGVWINSRFKFLLGTIPSACVLCFLKSASSISYKLPKLLHMLLYAFSKPMRASLAVRAHTHTRKLLNITALTTRSFTMSIKHTNSFSCPSLPAGCDVLH